MIMIAFVVFFIIVLTVFIVSLVGFIRAKRKQKLSNEPFSQEKLTTYKILLIISSAILGVIIVGYISLGVLLTSAVSFM